MYERRVSRRLIFSGRTRERRSMRLIDADKVDFNEVFVGASDFARETREAAKRLIDMQPTALDMADMLVQLEKRINTQLKIIVGLNDPVYRYGFTKSLEAYQQCRLILEDAIQENQDFNVLKEKEHGH